MAKGIFPQMSIADIMGAFASWGLSISQEQLVRPSPEFVEGVYCACLQQVTGLTPEALQGPLQDALSVVEDPDLYNSALSHNLLCHHLSRFARAARVEDFNAKDLAQPERERTLMILSAFINFVKFTEQWCSPLVKKQREDSAAIIVKRDHAAQEFKEVEVKIQIMKAKIAEDEPRCESLRKENAALRAHMFKTKEFQTAAVQEVEKLKAEKSELVHRKDVLNNEIANLSDAVVRTRSRIVQSPERIKRTIVTMGSTASEEKRVVAMHEGKARDLHAKINALLSIEKDLRGCVEQLQTIEKEVRSLEGSQKELADLKDHLEMKQIEQDELHLKSERVSKQFQNAQEKLERAQRHAEDRKINSQKTIERLQQECEQMALERRDNDRQVEDLRGEADEIEAKLSEHLKASQAELNELMGSYWKLRHETEVYMETLANKLNMAVSSD
ncbi:hypothetical protein HGRIS_013383 [Hohenbuehelia grisea]|uniref:Kinetochore protein NUF2 n=1 Tax=Hohenbuehelia grisea TaxID=104357 RepID=A0ABR3IVC8_9AGAR